MSDTDLERRVAAMEETQQRLRDDVVRLEQALSAARRPGWPFVIRVAVRLVVFALLVQIAVGLLPLTGSSLYHAGGSGAVWGVCLGGLALLGVILVASAVRRRRPR